MLDFFRKYQKIFFAVITFVIILSFSFFGTFSIISQAFSHKKAAKTIFQAIDQSNVTDQEVRTLSYFLSLDASSPTPNFFNRDWFAEKVIKSGLAENVFDSFSKQIKPLFDQKFQKAKTFSLYQHPEIPSLSAKNVWELYCPQKMEVFKRFQASPSFSDYVDLYLYERTFPPEMLRRALLYQQSRFPESGYDPVLSQGNLHLFANRSSGDWFPRSFMELLSEWVINVAKKAEQKGFKVSSQQAKYDLLKQLEGIDPKQSKGELFQRQLNILGLDEKTVLSIWKKVLLFDRYFDTQAQSVLLDDVIQKELEAYANELVDIEYYELPQDLKIPSISRFGEVEFYLSKITKEATNGIPTKIYSPEEMGSKFPELIYQNFEIEFSPLPKKNLYIEVGEKELWNWQCSKENWKMLCEQFPSLSEKEGIDRSRRYALINQQNPVNREKIDLFSRKKMALEKQIYEQRAWERAPLKSETIQVSKSFTSLKNVNHPANFQQFIQSLEPNDPKIYREDDHYWKITLKKEPSKKKIFSLNDASQKHILTDLLDHELESFFEKVRKKHTKRFQDENGEWKPFFQVRDEVIQLFFESSLKNLQKYKGIDKEAFVGSFRFFPYAKNQYDRLRGGDGFISTIDSSIIPLVFEKKVQTISHDSHHFQEVFVMKEGEFSSIHMSKDGSPCFYRVKTKRMDKEPLELRQQGLVNECKKHLASSILEEMKNKKAFLIQIDE